MPGAPPYRLIPLLPGHRRVVSIVLRTTRHRSTDRRSGNSDPNKAHVCHFVSSLYRCRKTDLSSDDEAPEGADDDGDDVSAEEFDADVNDVNDDREKSAGAKNVAVTPAVPLSM